MGQRSRKRGRVATGGRATQNGGEATARGYARGRARDDAIRSSLEPLAPGERPGAVTVAAITAVVLAITNVVFYAAGVEVEGSGGGGSGALLFAVIMLVAAWGMWKGRYWAVLGFQALLAITILIGAISLVVASNLWAVLLCLSVVGLGGALFWKLIRAMARLQMPERPGRR